MSMTTDINNNEAVSSNHDTIYTLTTVSQNQVQLVELADQKANILLGILVVVLTIVFVHQDQFLTNKNHFVVAVYIFLLIQATASFLAILVIIPSKLNWEKTSDLDKATNPLFFGVFTNYSEEVYTSFILNNLQDNNSARNLLIHNIYQTGVVLKRKYRFLRYSYIVAILGIVIPALVAFIILI